MNRLLREFIGKPPTHNVSSTEKWLSIGGGLMMMRKGLKSRGFSGTMGLLLGASAVYRGVRGYCPAKRKMQELRGQRLANTPARQK